MVRPGRKRWREQSLDGRHLTRRLLYTKMRGSKPVPRSNPSASLPTLTYPALSMISTPSGPRWVPTFGPVIALLLAAGCGGDTAAQASRPSRPARGAVDPINVGVAPVVRGAVSSSYGTSATLRAERRATVTSRTRGVIEELFVEEGDVVEAGKVLAQLEDDEQRLALTRAQSLLEIKDREFVRLTGLNEQEIISDNEVELIRRERADAALDVELAQLNLDRTSIRSPFASVVVQRWLDVGATVADGTEIFDVADVDPLYADVSVPERHVGRLAAGQNVHLAVDGLDAPVQGRIERLSPVVDSATGTVKVTVAVERSVELRPGAFVEVQIVTEVHDDVLVVPASRVGRRGAPLAAVPPRCGRGDRPSDRSRVGLRGRRSRRGRGDRRAFAVRR